MFDFNYAFTHNLSRSLRVNFNANTSSIIRQLDAIDSGLVNPFIPSKQILWQGLLNTGEPNNHIQSLAVNYKLPFQHLPFLSFIDATYNYT